MLIYKSAYIYKNKHFPESLNIYEWRERAKTCGEEKALGSKILE